jgi:hypothetical protein
MGYGFYFLQDGRPAGYMVEATCDQRGCEEVIDRGLGCLCGTDPDVWNGESGGCKRYFCGSHLGWVGPRGGCQHRSTKAWGKTLACMEVREESGFKTYCTNTTGHDGSHWEDL